MTDPRINETGSWQGTIPAEDTRRGVILAAIQTQIAQTPDDELSIADAIELALLEHPSPVVEGSSTWQFQIVESGDPLEDETEWCWRLNIAGETVVQSEGYPTEKQAEEKKDVFKTALKQVGLAL